MLSGNKGSERKEKFFIWLAQKSPAAQLTEMFLCFQQIESYCRRAKLSEKDFFEITDVNVVNAIRKNILKGKGFNHQYVTKEIRLIQSSLAYYMKFLLECNPAKTAGTVEKSTNKNIKNAAGISQKEKGTGNSGEASDKVLAEKFPLLYKRVYHFLEISHGTPKSVAEIYDYLNKKFRCDDIENILCKASWSVLSKNGYVLSVENTASGTPQTAADDVTENSEKAQDNGGSDFNALLADECYKLLRTKLVENGIDTIEKLKSIDLWPFMNKHELYSYALRFSLCSKIRKKLADESNQAEEKPAMDGNEPKLQPASGGNACLTDAAGVKEKAAKAKTLSGGGNLPDLPFKILYKNTAYTGNTPSEAFLAWLKYIAAKYPLRIRKLISVEHQETSNVVIRRLHPNRLKIPSLNAYISLDLTLEQVKVYIAWILERCDAKPLDFVVEKIADIDEEYQGPDADTKPEIKESDGLSSSIDTGPQLDSDNIKTETIPEKKEQDAADSSDLPDESQYAYKPTDKEFAVKEAKTTPEIKEGNEPQTSVDYRSGVGLDNLKKAEAYIGEKELDGASYSDLQSKLKCKMVLAKEIVVQSRHIIEMNQRLYLDEAFVDFEDGADAIEAILDKLFKQNSGIVTAVKLYEHACSDMAMFLNDNNIAGQREIYDLARYLFEKLKYHGKSYVFKSNTFISLPEIAADSTIGIIKKYALEKGTTVTFAEIEEYLKNMGLKSGNLRGIMKIDKEPVFFVYQENEYLLGELLALDDEFFDMVGSALKRLLKDGNDHVIIRNISDSWYSLLPTLPDFLEWTPMLVQQLLHYYSDKLGARTIIAMESQSTNTLHAMLVDNDSWIKDFRDVVAVFLHDELRERKSFEAEELRKILVSYGMISGNELINNMSRALEKDPRFIWNSDGTKVNVRL